MLDLVLHWYAYGEIYAIFLVWIVTPLAYYALFHYLLRRMGSAVANKSNAEAHHGED